MNENFAYMLLEIVSEIPIGKVATYQQVAELAGRKKNARLVGSILANASYYGDYPCHRVVSSVGRLVPKWDEQRDLLVKEGITFKKNGMVDMKLSKWRI